MSLPVIVTLLLTGVTARYGFAVVEDHGLDQAVIDRATADTKAFFAQDADTKKQWHEPGTGGARGPGHAGDRGDDAPERIGDPAGAAAPHQHADARDDDETGLDDQGEHARAGYAHPLAQRLADEDGDEDAHSEGDEGDATRGERRRLLLARQAEGDDDEVAGLIGDEDAKARERDGVDDATRRGQ